MSNLLSVRVPGTAEMTAMNAHLATIEIAIPGRVDDVTGAPRTSTALAELQSWCRRLARSRAVRGEPPLSLSARYGLVLGLYGALVPHVSPEGSIWREMLRAAGRFAEGQDEPVEPTYLLVAVRGSAQVKPLHPVEEPTDVVEEDPSPDPPTPQQWMLKYAEAHFAKTGKKLPRDAGVAACVAAPLGYGVTVAREAYSDLPEKLRFRRGEKHG